MGGSSSRCRKDKQSVIWCRRTEEGEEINHDLRDELNHLRKLLHQLKGHLGSRAGLTKEPDGIVSGEVFQWERATEETALKDAIFPL